jgi:DNA-binding LacI/PurR family transcriptional regulator
MGATKRLTIGLIVGNICNSFFSTVVRAIESTVLQYGYKVIVCNTDESIEMDLIHARELMEH